MPTSVPSFYLAPVSGQDPTTETGRLKKVKLGRFACYSVQARDFFDAANELLDIDEYSLIAEGVTLDDVNNDGRE